jgi:hypothetical protein
VAEHLKIGSVVVRNVDIEAIERHTDGTGTITLRSGRRYAVAKPDPIIKAWLVWINQQPKEEKDTSFLGAIFGDFFK